MHTPSWAWQCLTLAQLVDCWQSAEVAARHAPSFTEHAPSSLQRADCRHAALLVATHLPFAASHLPELVQALDFLHSSAVATHAPLCAVQRASSLHAAERAQSALEAATHWPFSALHRPCVARARGFGLFVHRAGAVQTRQRHALSRPSSRTGLRFRRSSRTRRARILRDPRTFLDTHRSCRASGSPANLCSPRRWLRCTPLARSCSDRAACTNSSQRSRAPTRRRKRRIRTRWNWRAWRIPARSCTHRRCHTRAGRSRTGWPASTLQQSRYDGTCFGPRACPRRSSVRLYRERRNVNSAL